MVTSGKITVLIKNLQHGGAQKVCITICKELVKRNYVLELWILDISKTTLIKQLPQNIKIVDLKEQNVRHSFIKLIKLFRKKKPSNLLIFNVELTILAIIIKRVFSFNTRIIFRSINTLSQAFQFPNSIWEKYFALKVIKLFLPMCDTIIAQSNGMRKDLIKYFNIDENHVITIPNPAINLLMTDPANHSSKMRENDFLFVGRLQPQKGLVNLLKIFADAHKQRSDFRLIIVGEGPEEERLKSLVNSLGLNSSVTLAGYQSNTLKYFEKAKATMLTSVYEGFPNVLVESIAAGTPVISFNCPSGPDDIIEPGINGILVPNQNLKAFTEAILSVANNNIQFSKQKIIKTSKKFSVEVVVDKYEQIIKNLQSNAN